MFAIRLNHVSEVSYSFSPRSGFRGSGKMLISAILAVTAAANFAIASQTKGGEVREPNSAVREQSLGDLSVQNDPGENQADLFKMAPAANVSPPRVFPLFSGPVGPSIGKTHFDLVSYTGGAEMHAGAFNSLRHAAHWIAAMFEAVGVLAIVMTTAEATARSWRTRAQGIHHILPTYKADLGRGVLLGLEFLVAADIVGMVAITPDFNSLGVLGLILLIRTFLSVSLNVEIEGCWPWHRHAAKPVNCERAS